ncbi:MAG: phosphoglycolate phosphatase [Methermicoccaceae archaeon]
MPRIGAIATDIDGTLTDDSRRLSPSVLETVNELDIPVILATGNSLYFTRAVAVLLGTCGAAVCENGAVLSVAMDAEPMVLAEKEVCLEGYELLKSHYDMRLLDFEYRKSEVVVARTFDAKKANELLHTTYPELEVVDTGFAFHIKFASMSKGEGVRTLLEALDWGVEMEQVAAFGDSMSDFSMLEAAGISVAVANSPTRLKGVATYVTDMPYGEGFAQGVSWLEEQGLL